MTEDDFNRLAAAASQMGQQQQRQSQPVDDPWSEQTAPTVIQQPSELQQWQAAYQDLKAKYNNLVEFVNNAESSQPQQTKPVMTQKSILSHPWFWAAVAVGVAAIAGGSLAIAGQQSAKKPTEQGKEQAIAATPTPTPETVNSSASTVMITIPGQGFAAAVLAEPTLQEIPGNIAGKLENKQTAELTGRTQGGFSEIKWGDGTKWISTCYTTPEGCSNQKTVGDLTSEGNARQNLQQTPP